jgi:hypothetical protein
MTRITKAEWDALGGLRSRHTARRQAPSGHWMYFKL